MHVADGATGNSMRFKREQLELISVKLLHASVCSAAVMNVMTFGSLTGPCRAINKKSGYVRLKLK